MKKVTLKQSKRILTWIMLVLCVNVWFVANCYADSSNESSGVEVDGNWKNDSHGNKMIIPCDISIYQNSQYLTIQDSNPVNTVTVRITRNDSGATVFENVYPQGQTGLIAIPLQGWSAGSYTIELFGRENNGYLVGTFQILP